MRNEENNDYIARCRRAITGSPLTRVCACALPKKDLPPVCNVGNILDSTAQQPYAMGMI